MQSYDKNLSCANVFKEKAIFSVKTFIKLEFIICLIIKRITRFLFKGKRAHPINQGENSLILYKICTFAP